MERQDNPSITHKRCAFGKIICKNYLNLNRFALYLTPHNGTVAQLVEQWTENPCVAGSSPAHPTSEN